MKKPRSQGPNVLELFPCSGGMAQGARCAGIEITMSIDWSADACASYEANHGHRPIRMDVRDLLRLVRAGWRPLERIDLLIADPPCTPWSRAGNRRGLDDDHDMLLETVELVRLLRPMEYLIANVPGLDDSPNWPVVQQTIGSLAREGYCVVDFARLDAADYGVPQHRVRPFWFGHLLGPCIQWPARTHGAPNECRPTLPGVDALQPYVTCRQALQHLSPEDLGRPIKLRWRGSSSAQHGSVPDRPARVVGTSNLSDGNVLVSGPTPEMKRAKRPSRKPRATHVDEVAGTVTCSNNGNGGVLYGGAHAPSSVDAPSKTIPASQPGNGAAVLLSGPNHRPSRADAPARTLTRNTHSDGALLVHDRHPISVADEPARTVKTSDGRGAQGAGVVAPWPWDRPSTTVVSTRDVVPPPGHHPESGSILSQPGAIKLSEKAAAILQGFPETWRFVGATKAARWDQIGMAMPPGLAEPVFRAIRRRWGERA